MAPYDPKFIALAVTYINEIIIRWSREQPYNIFLQNTAVKSIGTTLLAPLIHSKNLNVL